jgi:hypothetical protein
MKKTTHSTPGDMGTALLAVAALAAAMLVNYAAAWKYR